MNSLPPPPPGPPPPPSALLINQGIAAKYLGGKPIISTKSSHKLTSFWLSVAGLVVKNYFAFQYFECYLLTSEFALFSAFIVPPL